MMLVLVLACTKIKQTFGWVEVFVLVVIIILFIVREVWLLRRPLERVLTTTRSTCTSWRKYCSHCERLRDESEGTGTNFMRQEASAKNK